MSVRENASLPRLRMDQKAGAIDFGAEIEVATDMVKKMDIRTPGLEQVVQYLSGGNQQKIVLGKCLAMTPRMLLLDEPVVVRSPQIPEFLDYDQQLPFLGKKKTYLEKIRYLQIHSHEQASI